MVFRLKLHWIFQIWNEIQIFLHLISRKLLNKYFFIIFIFKNKEKLFKNSYAGTEFPRLFSIGCLMTLNDNQWNKGESFMWASPLKKKKKFHLHYFKLISNFDNNFHFLTIYNSIWKIKFFFRKTPAKKKIQ